MDPDPLPNLFLLALEPSISVSSIALISFVLVALLFLSAVLAGSEVAFFSLNADQRISLRESEVSSEKKVSHLLDKPQQLLATLLISINFVNIIFITLANYLTSMVLGQQSMETLLVTLFLLFGVTFIITFLEN